MNAADRSGAGVSGAKTSGGHLDELLLRLRRMTLLVRGEAGEDPARAHTRAHARGKCPSGSCSGRAAATQRQPGWWVLAQGEPLDPESFAAREAVRERLLERVRQTGLSTAENIWVWDESGRAQLVLATVPTRQRAERVAEALTLRMAERLAKRISDRLAAGQDISPEDTPLGFAVLVRREMP